MRHIIFTGTPGSGKITLLNELKSEGYNIISEAATNLIKRKQNIGILKPWESPNFIEEILAIQIKNRDLTVEPHFSNTIFYDRSPLCTYALCAFLNFKYPKSLLQKIKLIKITFSH